MKKVLTLVFIFLIIVSGCSRDQNIYDNNVDANNEVSNKIYGIFEDEYLSDSAYAVLGDEYKGEYLVVTFFATWCDNCTDNMDNLYSFYNDIVKTNDNINMLFINLTASEKISDDEIRSYYKNLGFEMTIVFDRQSEMASEFIVQYIPLTLIVNSEGKIIYRKSGMTYIEELEEALEEII